MVSFTDGGLCEVTLVPHGSFEYNVNVTRFMSERQNGHLTTGRMVFTSQLGEDVDLLVQDLF